MESIRGLLENLPHVFSTYNLIILLVGTFGGIILGALPGVSPTLAVALLVPFTFYMDPTTGLILLGAVYASSVAGGAISAILINVPGAPANIATLLDGYPLARAGKAQSTLYTCFISSWIGGIFGMVVMILLTFPMAEFALKFKSTELFWVSILGLTVVAGLGSGSLIKSLIAGAFGVWLSTIGPNPTTGEFRFIFHSVLTGGVHIIPALIGLFAIPQVFNLIEGYGRGRTVLEFKPERGVLKETFLRVLRMRKTLTIGSIIGTIIGLIPGVGGQVAGIVAYDQVKKLSRHPETFGKGNPEGVAAAESANNAMVGPSLVPLLTLSVPGSPTAAVLLGGLLIHGIFPGPNLFLLHGDLVHTFIGALLVTQFVMLVFGIILSRYSYLVMRVPDLYMAASIMVLAVFGTYTVNNSFNDVVVMFAIGSLMYLGNKYGFSAAPVVMGLILGGIAENNFLKGMLIAEAGPGFLKHFFTGWINIVLILLCVASVVFGLLGTRKGRTGKPVSFSDLPASLIILLIALVLDRVVLKVRDPLSGIFPHATLLGMALLSAILFFQSLVKLLKRQYTRSPVQWNLTARMIVTFFVVVLYLWTLQPIGFYTASLAFHLIFPFVFETERKGYLRRAPVKVGISLCFIVVIYILFRVIMKTPTPTGLFL